MTCLLCKVFLQVCGAFVMFEEDFRLHGEPRVVVPF